MNDRMNASPNGQPHQNRPNAKPTPSLDVDVSSVGTDRRPRFEITVKAGSRVIHLDTANLGQSRVRTRVAQDIVRQAESAGITTNVQLMEQHLLDGLTASQPTQEELMELVLAEGPNALGSMGIEVLGVNSDRSTELFFRSTQTTLTLKSPARWAPEEMLQAIGPRLASQLHTGKHETRPDGAFTPSELRQDVALAAARAPALGSTRRLGPGVYRRGDDLLIVDGRGAWATRRGEQKLRRLGVPRYRRELIDLANGEPWGGKRLRRLIREMSSDLARQAIGELTPLIAQMNWTNPGDPAVLALLAAATFVQDVWSWRPLVSIIGPSNSGKSTLLSSLLKPLFGKLCLLTNESTEAGIRQAMQNGMIPTLIDEFDEYQQRHKVLELFRVAGRGGQVLRGSAEHVAHSFEVRHLAWFAAIESGDNRQQDRNRFLRFELQLPDASSEMRWPPVDELHQLGLRVAAAAIWAAIPAAKLAEQIRGTPIEGLSRRAVESFAVPAALHAVFQHGCEATREQAVESLQLLTSGRVSEDRFAQTEESRLVTDILSEALRIPADSTSGRTEERSVAELLLPALQRAAGIAPTARQTDRSSRGLHELELAGIRVVSRGSEPAVFIDDDRVRRGLLSRTRWKGARIDQLLLRLAGAERSQQRIAATRSSGVLIPASVLPLVDSDEDNHVAR